MAIDMARLDRERVTRAPDLVRWGPVVAGVLIGLGVFALVNSLWLAFAYDSGNGWVSDNLGWYIGATAAGALFLAGFSAGLLAGVRGMGAGLANGITTWGLLFVLSLTAIIPGAVNLTARLGTGVQQGTTTVGGSLGAPGGGFTVESALWTTFWSLLIGGALAAVGGVLGGTLRRPVLVAEERERDRGPTPPPSRPTNRPTGGGRLR